MINKTKLFSLALIALGIFVLGANAQTASATNYLLWSNTDNDGMASLWSLDSGNNYVSAKEYQTDSDWTAMDFWQNQSGTNRYLLWSKTDGTANLWTLDQENDYKSSKQYTLGADKDGWKATDFFSNESGSVRYLLWSNGNGSAVLWTLNSSNNYTGTKSYSYSGTTGWTAETYYQSENGETRYLLWSNSENSWTALWLLNSSNNYAGYDDFGRDSDWMATDYSRTPTSSTRYLLWSNENDGTASLWSLNSSNNYTSAKEYDSYGDWVARSYWRQTSDSSSSSSWLRVVSPNGGESWTTGRTYTISYTGEDIDAVKIDLYKNGYYYQTIANADGVYSDDNNSSYSWTIPESITTGSDYRIKIRDLFDSSVSDQGNKNFTITQSNDNSYSYIADGALIRNPNASGDAKFDIYIVKLVNGKKFKRLILSPSVFSSYGHLNASNVILVNQSTMDSFVTSDLVRAVGDERVYRLYPSGDTGTKRWVKTASAFYRLGFDWDSIYTINTFDRDSYWAGDSIE